VPTSHRYGCTSWEKVHNLLENIKDISDATQIANASKGTYIAFQSGHEVFSTASIGIAFGTTGYNRPEDILRDADTNVPLKTRQAF